MSQRSSSCRPALLFVACAILTLTGCVRESVSPEATIYSLKWWAFLWPVLCVLRAMASMSNVSSTHQDGTWTPWWHPRLWHYRSYGATIGCLVVAVMLLVEFSVSSHRLEVSDRGLRLSSAVSATSIEWRQLERIDFRTAEPGGPWTPDRDREHRKQPMMVLVMRDGSQHEMSGWPVRRARADLTQRAEAAGVVVRETDRPGGAEPMVPFAPGAPRFPVPRAPDPRHPDPFLEGAFQPAAPERPRPGDDLRQRINRLRQGN